MGISVEFNPDLALRNFEEFKLGKRKKEECIPGDLKEGKTYSFLKKDQRNYWFDGEVPLLETKGNAILSRPIASIKIVEATHFLLDSQVFTRGTYKVIEVFKDSQVHFESYQKLPRKDLIK
ncbi:MAG: hypothetical protein UT05_C0019G0010 [Parcubacteria group bacterium GW2011_GWF2_38_76]|nr:MAG: hypothetical protein UT05_C0019G0010 [Parcubacteria group bacterium GW2011_GWF2_38_76]